jgi:2-polyprenyl-3-methyl-5-hydroxy-6-metoxy-1,4-benzoquinol methylase
VSGNNALVRVQGPRLRALDRAIRAIRLRRVGKHLPDRAAALDVGCYDGSLFSRYASTISLGVGIDPLIAAPSQNGRFRFIADTFPSDALGHTNGTFDVITFIAVLEHVPTDDLPVWRDACESLLRPGGLVIATIPSPAVDTILHGLMRVGLVEGMSVHEHHGVDPRSIAAVLSSGSLREIAHQRFEFRLNNLYVFRKQVE